MNKLFHGNPLVLAMIVVLVATLSSCTESDSERAELSQPTQTKSALLDRARAIHEAALVLRNCHVGPVEPRLIYVFSDDFSPFGNSKKLHCISII